MSYQVLARKWRPRLFREMVGQTHVLQALINALDHDRLHHAYLFTGTRGVGKTSIARILAKCLNCETGVSSEPCGVCSACREIDEGRFVDLIEVDAASRTKVEDTRELLDNVQYAPSRGRYKVYLIDEVHMLSSHSFNALLKTLEEPPEHVKFLLATTDPQKLPVTVLSRCLQFSLKNMLPEKIVDHLKHVLGEEMIRFDEESLWLLGRAADGSMRDALSLTDQAIAFGNGALQIADVRSMLGTIDHGQVFGLLEALAADDAPGVLAAVAQLAEQGADFSGVLAELISTLQRVAITQVLPAAADNSLGDQARVLDLAGRLSAEDVQLFYQLGLHGRRDLPLAPDPRGGFEMALLRMLAFRPGTLQSGTVQSGTSQSVRGQQDAAEPRPAPPGKSLGLSQAKAESQAPEAANIPASAVSAAVTPPIASAETTAKSPKTNIAPPAASTEQPVDDSAQESQPPVTRAHAGSAPLKAGTPVKPPLDEPPTEWLEAIPDDDASDNDSDADDEVLDISPYLGDWQPEAETAALLAEDELVSVEDSISELPPASGLAAEWLAIFLQLGLSGLTQSIAAHCQLVARSAEAWTLHLDPGHSALYNENHRLRLQQALGEHLNQSIVLEVKTQAPDQETPAIAAARRKFKRQQEAEACIRQDPLVLGLMQAFSAEICADSIRPIDAAKL
ncbi:DNA polymerase III subunit gamma/tau [Halopseudomonas pelagia]|uniref:DNA polymerase III subunit gamma/tau n=1 Tax=Halopseudomonas pelagia TaxID=553151 RepID=UPI00039AD7AB|nr:DNA polymerase III subunit gamma/tau [Halopseudomonas pelagia]|tara:strand:- start:76767 stop:78800 length:2034 start_codon:yes stop_codon:yes gene_type:complete